MCFGDPVIFGLFQSVVFLAVCFSFLTGGWDVPPYPKGCKAQSQPCSLFLLVVRSLPGRTRDWTTEICLAIFRFSIINLMPCFIQIGMYFFLVWLAKLESYTIAQKLTSVLRFVNLLGLKFTFMCQKWFLCLFGIWIFVPIPLTFKD